VAAQRQQHKVGFRQPVPRNVLIDKIDIERVSLGKSARKRQHSWREFHADDAAQTTDRMPQVGEIAARPATKLDNGIARRERQTCDRPRAHAEQGQHQEMVDQRDVRREPVVSLSYANAMFQFLNSGIFPDARYAVVD
jgi:hypothetical protein